MGFPAGFNDFIVSEAASHSDVVTHARITYERILKHSAEGLSQAALAELVGVSRNTISSIETGQFNPTAKLALILCIALDQRFEELFYFEEE